MTKKIITLCSIVIVLSLCFAVFSVGLKVEKNDVTTANMKTFCAEKSEITTSGAMNGLESYSASSRADKATGKIEEASNKVDEAIDKIEDASNKVDDAIGGLGDTLGGIGDAIGEIGSGSSGGIGDVIGGIGSGSSGNIGDVIGGIGSGSSGGLGDAIGGMGDALGGVGDALSGIGSGALSGLGDVFGGLFGGSGSTTNATTLPITTQRYDTGLIIPVPAATQTATETQTETQTASTDDESKATGETVDYAATSNPYTKPTATFVAGDEDETIKWLQWIFVYTGYGLEDDGITGVLDEDTVAVVKKLQKENKMTVDGNITEDVIKAAEVLYYQSILGGDVSAIEISSQATTGVNVSYEAVGADDGDGVSAILLIVILVIIWVLAIGGIVLLFIFKKKKATSQKSEQTKTKEKNDASQTEAKETLSSIADLFEEAEKKNK